MLVAWGFLQSERLAMVASVIGFVAFLVASYLPAPMSLWYVQESGGGEDKRGWAGDSHEAN